MKTVWIKGDNKTGKTDLADKIAKLYKYPKWCNIRNHHAYYGDKIINGMFDNVNEYTDLIIIDNINATMAKHLIMVFEQSNKMIVRRKNLSDIMIDVPDLIVITH